MLSLEVLLRIEQLLEEETNAGPDFVLGDYFDYIGGTSTGAIIAAGLAMGMRVQQLLDLYEERGEEMFDKAALLRKFRYRYGNQRIEKLLKDVLGKDTKLGSLNMRCLLLMVLRNATTDSPWPLSNNPSGRYNTPGADNDNLKLPLWQLVRASTAAPTYFPPEVVGIGDHDFIFVDGGMTMYNNPAFQLFLMATLEPYGLCWPSGESEMLLVSVGTGTSPKADDALQAEDMNLLYNAQSVPAALMSAALNEQDMLCRVLGRCRHGAKLDREIGDLIGSKGIIEPRLFTYARYNAELTTRGLRELDLGDIKASDVQRLDSVDHIADLRRVGKAVANQVRVEHFEGFLA